MKYYKVVAPFERKDFDKTGSAKFKGELTFYANEFGVIYKWTVDFKELFIDVYTTERWFKDKTPTFVNRENLFAKLGLKQEVRPGKSSNKIVQIHDLKTVNDYFNNDYFSTIKNIVGVLKGNNPGGEAKKPGSAELILSSIPTFKNFTILLDDLIVKNEFSTQVLSILSTEISLLDYININPKIKAAFEFMQNPKSPTEFTLYLKGIKEYVKQYKTDLNLISKQIDRARSQYGKNVEANIKKLPFNFTDSREYQKAHIFDVRYIREEAIRLVQRGEDKSRITDLINAVKDFNNFLPLSESVHREFDKYMFTWNTDGKLISKNIDKFISSIKTKFGKIPEWFMTPERKKYLIMRMKIYNQENQISK